VSKQQAIEPYGEMQAYLNNELTEMCIKLIATAYFFLEMIPFIQWIVGPGSIYDLSKLKLPLP
jgi:hypothetical protein